MTMIGIDPHKATHTAVAVGDNEVVLDEFRVRASTVQAQRLREWAGGFGKREWALESVMCRRGLRRIVSDLTGPDHVGSVSS